MENNSQTPSLSLSLSLCAAEHGVTKKKPHSYLYAPRIITEKKKDPEEEEGDPIGPGYYDIENAGKKKKAGEDKKNAIFASKTGRFSLKTVDTPAPGEKKWIDRDR